MQNFLSYFYAGNLPDSIGRIRFLARVNSTTIFCNIIAILSPAIYLYLIVNSIMLSLRRMNDIGIKGRKWKVFLVLIPVVNFIVFLYLLFTPGSSDNIESITPLSKPTIFEYILAFLGSPIAIITSILIEALAQ